MRTFILEPSNLAKWMKQNEGVYSGDFFAGSLQDNFVVYAKRGYAFVYERFRNTHSSDYLVKFVPYKDKQGCDELWDEWNKAYQEFEEDYGVTE